MKVGVSMAVTFSPEASSMAGAAVSMAMYLRRLKAHLSVRGFSLLLGAVSDSQVWTSLERFLCVPLSHRGPLVPPSIRSPALVRVFQHVIGLSWIFCKAGRIPLG